MSYSLRVIQMLGGLPESDIEKCIGFVNEHQVSFETDALNIDYEEAIEALRYEITANKAAGKSYEDQATCIDMMMRVMQAQSKAVVAQMQHNPVTEYYVEMEGTGDKMFLIVPEACSKEEIEKIAHGAINWFVPVTYGWLH